MDTPCGTSASSPSATSAGLGAVRGGRPPLLPPDRGRRAGGRRVQGAVAARLGAERLVRRARDLDGGGRPGQGGASDWRRRGPARRPRAGCRPVLDPTGKRVWVAGHRGLVGLRPDAAARARAGRRDRDRHVAPRSICAGRARPSGSSSDATARRDLPRGGAGRRHPGEPTRPGRVPLRQPDDRGERPARRRGGPACRRSVVLGSSCIYPRDAPQPITEDALLTGPLEPTNEGYAIAKIAGARARARCIAGSTACDVISLMPTNLYGPGDNFDPSDEPRPARAAPQDPRGEGVRQRTRSRSGARARRGASSCTWTTWPTPPCSSRNYEGEST